MKNDNPYITLGQFLKKESYVNSGGEVKHLIHTFNIKVNGEKEDRRGRKLYPGDEVSINDSTYTIALDED